MNVLIITDKNGILTVDSREVAEMVEKNHNHLMRDIRNYESQILTNPKLDSSDFFIKSSYKDAKGEERESYLLTRKGCEFVANKMTGKKGTIFTATYVDRFHVMEETLKNPVMKVPTTMKEALLIALDLESENQELKGTIEIQTQLIEESRPKLEYLDMILGSEDTMAISQIGADYDMSGQALNRILHEQGFIRNVNKQWILYKEHMDKGYTKSDTFPVPKKDGSEKIVANTKYTQKGRLKIHEILTQLGREANCDKEKKRM